MSLTTLKWAAILCFVVAMAVLLGGGIVMKKDLPPYPGKVVGPDGKVLFEKADIIAGQDVYQRYGLMDQGAVWGHGSQRGPEFSAASACTSWPRPSVIISPKKTMANLITTWMTFKRESSMSKSPTRPNPIAMTRPQIPSR